MHSTYGLPLKDWDGNIVTSGYLLTLGGQMHYFRPDCGLYDVVGGYYSGDYGFAECNFNESMHEIKIIYSGGTPYQPNYVFTTSLTATSCYEFYTPNTFVISDIEQKDNTYPCTITYLDDTDIQIPAFKIATIGEARALNDPMPSLAFGDTDDKLLLAGRMSSYNVGFKQVGYVNDSDTYSSYQYVCVDDLDSIQTTVRLEFDLPTASTTEGPSGINISMPLVYGSIIIKQMKPGSNQLEVLDTINISQNISPIEYNILQGTRIYWDATNSGGSQNYGGYTTYLDIVFDDKHDYVWSGFTGYYNIVTRKNEVDTITFRFQKRTNIIENEVSISQYEMLTQDADYFYIQADSNNDCPIAIFYDLFTENYMPIGHYQTDVINTGIKYSYDKQTWYDLQILKELTGNISNRTLFNTIDYEGMQIYILRKYGINYADWKNLGIDMNHQYVKDYINDAKGIYLEPGQKVYFKGNNPNGLEYYINGVRCYGGFIQMADEYEEDGYDGRRAWYKTVPIGSHKENGQWIYTDYSHLGGNIMTLIDEIGETKQIPNSRCFYAMFGYSLGYNYDDSSKEFKGLFNLRIESVGSNLLPATRLNNGCYEDMFAGQKFLRETPLLQPNSNAKDAFKNMFLNCSMLNNVKCKTILLGDYYSHNWLKSVYSTGTFYGQSAHANITKGDSSVPKNWTVTILSS